MLINVYMIAKKSNDEYDKIINHFIKNSLKFATIKFHYIFNNQISKAQTIDEVQAKISYTDSYVRFLSQGYNIALDVKGKQLDSYRFADILKNKSNINIFIGGAYGFEDKFLKNCDDIISLSNLTFAHKIASVVLSEQIFRSLSINNSHPYHK